MVIRVRVRGANTLERQLGTELTQIVRRDMNRRNRLLVDDLVANTPRDTGRAAQAWRVTPVITPLATFGALTFDLVNPVDYITQLNMGSSIQAPARFVERIANRYYTQVRSFGVRS